MKGNFYVLWRIHFKYKLAHGQFFLRTAAYSILQLCITSAYRFVCYDAGASKKNGEAEMEKLKIRIAFELNKVAGLLLGALVT